MNLQEYEDPNTKAEHISLRSPRSASLEANDFRELLTRHGWVIYRDQGMQSNGRGYVLEAQKGIDLAHVTLQPSVHSGTHIIVIWRKG